MQCGKHPENTQVRPSMCQVFAQVILHKCIYYVCVLFSVDHSEDALECLIKCQENHYVAFAKISTFNPHKLLIL